MRGAEVVPSNGPDPSSEPGGEELDARFLEHAPFAIYTIDREGLVRSWNPAAERIFGWTAAEAVGRFLPFVQAEARTEFGTRLARVLEGEIIRSQELVRRRKDGSPVHLRLTAAPLGPGRPAALAMGMAEDITERKKLEEQFRQAQKMEAVGQLAGGLAHDFNNLLTGIMSYSQLLLTGLSAHDPRKADLEEILRGAERGAALTRQLLALGRRQVLKPRVLDIDQLVGSLANLLGRLLGESIELEVACRAPQGRVRADPGQLEQVLVNLVVNARDAMPGGGRLGIETEVRRGPAPGAIDIPDRTDPRSPLESGDWVLVRVTDTGTGIAPEIRGRIFEPFFTTKEPGKGTGLGLATAYGIVTQSGGTLTVESAPGRGASFSILLPLVEEEADPVVPAGRVDAAALLRGTVLLVEDDALVRAPTRRSLEAHGLAVIEAADAEAARALAGERIDLVVSDLVLPRGSGVALVRELRRDRPGLPALYLSGHAEGERPELDAADPRSEFLAKPFTGNQLMARVIQLLGRRS